MGESQTVETWLKRAGPAGPMPFCTACGASNEAGAAFCAQCGTPVAGGVAARVRIETNPK